MPSSMLSKIGHRPPGFSVAYSLAQELSHLTFAMHDKESFTLSGLESITPCSVLQGE